MRQYAGAPIPPPSMLVPTDATIPLSLRIYFFDEATLILLHNVRFGVRSAVEKMIISLLAISTSFAPFIWVDTPALSGH
jgi:hypothetical protein